jgi:hypothetical protein
VRWLVAEQFPVESVRSTRRLRPDWVPDGVTASVGFRNKSAVGVQAWWFSAGRSGKWTKRRAQAWLRKQGARTTLVEHRERPRLALNLRAAREASGLSQVDVAGCCELTSQYISDLECGALPSLRVLALLSVVYDVTVAALLAGVSVDELLDS